MIHIGIVGDVMLTNPLHLFQRSERSSWLQAWLGDVDVAIANLEMALPEVASPADKLSVIGSESRFLKEIARCGFSTVTLANNHMMDHGTQGLLDTLAVVDKAGLQSVGAGPDIDAASRPLIIEVGNARRLAILNFACTLPPGSAAGPARPGIAPIRVTQQHEIDPIFIQEQPGTAPWVNTYVREQDSRLICERIAQVRETADFVLAVIHWGVPPHWQAPFQGFLATYQRPLARTLIEAGANAIVGHHPHVLHGVEVIDNCPVFYSLGNFIWHHRTKQEVNGNKPLYEPGYRLHWREALAISAVDPRKRESLFLHLTFRDDGWYAKLRPVWLDDMGEPSLPAPDKSQEILNRINTMSMQLGCTLTLDSNSARISGSYS